MLLQCEIQDGDAGAASGWLRRDLAGSLLELNEGCLALLAEQSRAAAPADALLGVFAEHWAHLGAEARQRAAGCPYLLFDLGFAEVRRWQRSAAGQATAEPAMPYFTVPTAAGAAQAVAVYAWHLAHSHGSAAQLLLGMSASGVAALTHCTLGQVRELAAAHPHWLRPRWPEQPRVWRELLAAAATGDARALWRARLRGQTLLAAQTRAQSAQRTGRSGLRAARPPTRPAAGALPPAPREAKQLHVRF
jgi:hypothetical protein